MMFKAKAASETKVVNLELNSRKKKSKKGFQINLLKCSLAVNAGTLFQVIDVRIYMELQGLLSLLILTCLSLKHKLKQMSRRCYF